MSKTPSGIDHANEFPLLCERLTCRHVELGLARDAVRSPILQARVPTLLDAGMPVWA